MSDATAWIDPELVAAGKLLQEKGLVSPDRTVASLAERLALSRSKFAARFKAVVGETFSLNEAAQAHEISQSGHGRGRIILQVV